MSWFMDRKVRLARVWSNRELAKFAGIFGGDVVNVSAWKDQDKEGRRYRDYFTSAGSYSITNYLTEDRGFQESIENQFYLDLEKPLPEELRERFNVVFNHTVLEHVFDIDRAFSNLCALTSDIAILVVPFMQHQHAAYGDYWRFTPEGVSKLFEKNSMELLYISYNDGPNQSVYVFAIASKNPAGWKEIRNHPDNRIAHLTEKVGHRVVRQSLAFHARELAVRILLKVRRLVRSLVPRRGGQDGGA